MGNTITAYFKGRAGVAESVYQNDYGMVMVFDGIYLPAHFDCYFSVSESTEAIPAVGADNRVAIPNSVLANSGKVEIHIPLHTGENDSEVEYVVYFKVIGRARPIDDGTPEQMTAIEQALALLQTPIGNMEQIVEEAIETLEIQTDKIADGAVSQTKFHSDTLPYYTLIPDHFSGTDADKVQSCLDALVSTGGVILINREYDIKHDLIHKIDSNSDLPIYFQGIGKDAAINMNSYSFKGNWSNANEHYPGNLFFDKIRFTGTGTCFDCNTLIRLYVTDCYFTSFSSVFECSMTDSARMQTIYVSNCVFRRLGDCFKNHGGLADVHIVNNNFEWTDTVYDTNDADIVNGLFIENNLMEGIIGTAIKIRNARKVIISGNYFESNEKNIVCDDAQSFGVSITNNTAAGNSGESFVYLPIDGHNWDGVNQNVIEHNTMIARALEIIGFEGTPKGFLNWKVENNYCNALSDTYRALLNSKDRLSGFGITATDFNTAIASGHYIVDYNTANNPSDLIGNLIVYQGTGRYIEQNFTPLTDPATRYVRTGIATYSQANGWSVSWNEWASYKKDRVITATIDNVTDGTFTLEALSTYLITIAVGTDVGLYLLRVTSSGGGSVKTISSTSAGTMTVSSKVLTIAHTSSAQVVSIVKLT